MEFPFRVLCSRQKMSNKLKMSSVSASGKVLLDKPIFLQGLVAKGYGRGSKKLGFPTANLPYFDSLIESNGLSNGVYVGWASLRHIPDQRFTVVSNIGYSPTFAGQENKVRIVESYLLPSPNNAVPLADFYGSYLRLFLIGFIRPEMKFGSSAELTEQIQADVITAGTICGNGINSPSSALPPALLPTAQKWLFLGYEDNTSTVSATTQRDTVIVETFSVPESSEKHVCLWARPSV